MRNQSSITGELLRRRALIRIGYPILIAPLVNRRILAMTIGRRIWIHPRVLEEAPATLKLLIEHELVHVAQYHRDGVVGFLARYSWEYLRGRWAGKNHYEAYRAVSYELEAWSVGD